MTTFVTLIGLVVGILVFINLVHAKSSMEGMNLTLEEDEIKKQIRSGKKRPILENAQFRRICPVCKTGLFQDEYLLCAMQAEPKNGGKRQVHIYGCPHCFLSDGVNINGNQLENISDFNV